MLGIANAQTIKIIEKDPQQAGLQTPAAAGFSDQLWAGSDRQSLGDALEGVDRPIRYKEAFATIRDMVSSAAPLPAGEGLSPTILTRRIQALGQLGAHPETLALIERTPASAQGIGVWQAAANIGLIRNDLIGACELSSRYGSGEETPFWLKLRGFCEQLRGNGDAAIDAAIAATDAENPPDETYAALFLALSSRDLTGVDSVVPERPIHLAILRALSQAPPSGFDYGSVPADVASGFVGYASLGPLARMKAAERAAAANVLGAGTLLQLYLQSPFQTETGSAYLAAVKAKNALQRVDALADLWRKAAGQGLFAQLAPFSAKLVRQTDLIAGQPAFLLSALRTGLVAGNAKLAEQAIDALAAAALVPNGTEAQDISYALRALAGKPVPPAEDWWPRWVDATGANNQQQQLVGGMLGAFGQSFSLMPSPKIRKNKATRAILAVENAPGEAALRALNALAGAKANDVAAQVLAVRLSARVSQARARLLAVELAIAAGL